MVASSVNLLCHTLLTTLVPALPRTSGVRDDERCTSTEIRRSGHVPHFVSTTSPGEPNPPQRTPALTGHYMVDIATSHDDQYPSEHFVASGRQMIPLTGNRDLEHGDILGTAFAPLLRVPLKALVQHNEQSDVTAVSEVTATNAAPTSSEQPSTELLHRLDDDQREAFFRLWSTVPHYMRQIDFALDAPGWDSDAIDALSATLKEYADIFSSSKLDYGACSLRPFEIKGPPGTHPIQSRPYRLNPVLSKQVDAILDSYLAAGLIQHSTSPWSSPLVCVSKKSGGIRITVNYQKLNKVTEIPQIAIPRVDEVLDTLGGGSVFSVFDLFSGLTQLTIHQETIPLTAFCTPNGLYEWLRMPQGAAGSPAWFVSVMRLVTDGVDNIRMYLDDAIGPDASPMAHMATLATFFARLRLHNLKLSPNISRIGAARVDFLGHVTSQDGVRPNDDKIAALAHMPMLRDIKQLRSLLGGLSYYRKFLPNMAKRVKSITSLLKKGAVFDFTPTMETAVRALLAELAAPPILIFLDWDASPDRFVYTAMPAPMASEQLSSRSSLTAPSAPLSILAEQRSLTNGIGPPWNSRPDALCGVSVAYAVTYLAFSF